MNQTPDPMEELILLCQTLECPTPLSQKDGEDQLCDAVWHKDWDRALELLDRIPGPVSRETATTCLAASLRSAPFSVFCTLLDHFPWAEYAYTEKYPLKQSPTGETQHHFRWEVTVQGTLLLHAVAENRPDVLTALLDRGHDVNSASSAAAAGLLQDCGENVVSYGREFVPFYPYTARPESRFFLHPWDSDPNDIPPLEWEGTTALALAVLMGHADCARILADRGAWLEEAPGVSRSMYLFWLEQDEAYQTTRTVVLEHPHPSGHQPQLWAIGQTCSPEQLEQILKTYSYSDEELVRAAKHMLRRFHSQSQLWLNPLVHWWQLCRKLLLVGRICPQALCTPEVVGTLLDLYSPSKKRTLNAFFPIWHGKTLDISWMGSTIFRLTQPDIRPLLENLARQCTLVLDRDGVSPGIDEKSVRLLLKHTTLLPPSTRRGISGLTLAILRCGDLRLLRKAIQTGVIPPEESTQELLQYQKEAMVTPELRLVLLATSRPTPAQSLRISELPGELQAHWYPDSFPTCAASLPAQSDLDILFPSLFRSCGNWTLETQKHLWQFHNTFFAACVQGREDIISYWLTHAPYQDLRNTDSIVCSSHAFHMITTPLCVAAFAGQVGIVRLLLEYGAAADESLWGNPSILCTHWTEEGQRRYFPMNPLLAALVGKHWDCAAFLANQGARCDLNDPRTQEVWYSFHQENIQDTVPQCLRQKLCNMN